MTRYLRRWDMLSERIFPVQGNTFPFDILLVGGDDIVIVTPADKALQVAYTLAEQFHQLTGSNIRSPSVLYLLR